jgi:RNA polymerase sigma-70 factor (ECF subfamily)
LVPETDVTALLVEVANGNQAAQEKLVPLVYDQLKRLARRYMRRERADHTLQTTALVHEAYLKLVRQQSPNWQCRAQFFGIAAQLMRRILIDQAAATYGRNVAELRWFCPWMRHLLFPRNTPKTC